MTRYPSDDKDVSFPPKKQSGSADDPAPTRAPDTSNASGKQVADTPADPGWFGAEDFGSLRPNASRGSDRDERAMDGGDGRSMMDEGRDFVRRKLERREPGAANSNLRSHARCEEIMTREVATATRDTTLERVAQMMRDEDTGIIPVVEPVEDSTKNGKLVGLITDRDVVVRAVAEGRDARSMSAEEAMSTTLYTARPEDRVIDVIRMMGDKQVRRIPVVDDQGLLKGIISMADVALETEEDRDVAEALEEISSGQSFWSKIVGG